MERLPCWVLPHTPGLCPCPWQQTESGPALGFSEIRTFYQNVNQCVASFVKKTLLWKGMVHSSPSFQSQYYCLPSSSSDCLNVFRLFVRLFPRWLWFPFCPGSLQTHNWGSHLVHTPYGALLSYRTAMSPIPHCIIQIPLATCTEVATLSFYWLSNTKL